MARKAAATAVLDVPASFGNFSAGDKTCRLGATVPREWLTIAKADKVLCDQRLTAQLFRKPAGEAQEQGTFDGMEEPPVEVVVDVKGFRVNAESIVFGMTGMKKSCDKDAMMELAQKAGRIVVTATEDIETGEEPEDEDEDGDEE